MRVLTWNTWWRHGPWRQRREAIAATLADLRPDICGLQEVWGRAAATDPADQSGAAPAGQGEDAPAENLAADLAGRLGMYWCWAGRPRLTHREVAEDDQPFWFGNAVLSRWPITAWSQTPLPVPDGQQRLVLHAEIDAPAGRLPFFTTHFSHSPGASALRLAQARTLAGFVAAHSRADDPYPPVVTGDLNAEPDADELRLLGGLLTAPAVPGLVLIDAWRYAGPGAPGYTWDHRNPHLTDDPYPDARVDYVLVGTARAGRGRVRGLRLAGDSAVSLPADAHGGGVWPSDHFGVVVDLTP